MRTWCDDKVINVLVTGFGNFNGSEENSSWLIASRLPEYLPTTPDAPSLPRVRIHFYEVPIAVRYTTVTEAIQKLWDAEARGVKYDLAIHIGMAGPEAQYRLESLAHHDGYEHKDEAGKYIEESELLPGWEDMPVVLRPDLGISKIMRLWLKFVPTNTKVIMSEDPGRFLCDFMYYSSLATLRAKSEQKRAVFLHVPKGYTDSEIDTGCLVCLALIRSIVESIVFSAEPPTESDD